MNNIMPNGTIVNIKEAGIKGKTIAFAVTGMETPIIEYNVIRWCNGDRKTEWLYDHEVEKFLDTSKKAGMVNYETDLILSK